MPRKEKENNVFVKIFSHRISSAWNTACEIRLSLFGGEYARVLRDTRSSIRYTLYIRDEITKVSNHDPYMPLYKYLGTCIETIDKALEDGVSGMTLEWSVSTYVFLVHTVRSTGILRTTYSVVIRIVVLRSP